MFTLHAARAADTSQEPSRATSGRRYRFNVLDERGLRDVIVDVGDDGHEEWSDQYPGEVRWHPFNPSDAERGMLRRWGADESEAPPVVLRVRR